MKVKKHTIAAIIDTHKHATGNAQRGIVTHHHDQLMMLQSFSVMKIKPRIAQNGKLLEVVF